MTTLAKLNIYGAITPCSLSVRVQFQLPGATVRIIANGIEVGNGIAQWPDQTFTINTLLNPGDSVIARQEHAGYVTSIDSNVATVIKLPTVAQLAKGLFATPIYDCAECIQLYNLYPGAHVKVRLQNDQVIGEADAQEDGNAFVNLTEFLPHGTPVNLSAEQTACPASGSPVTGSFASTQPTVVYKNIDLPQVQSPTAYVCQTAIQVNGIVRGAAVTIRTNTGLVYETCVAPTELIQWISPLTIADNPLTITEEYIHCKLKSIPLTVQVIEHLPQPTGSDYLCEGTTQIDINGLIPTATFELTINDAVAHTTQTYIGAVPARPENSPVYSFITIPVPLLKQGFVTIRQGLCLDSSPTNWSDALTIPVKSALPAQPVLISPCGNPQANSLTPMLKWQDSSACDTLLQYEIQLATDASFTSGIIDFQVILGLMAQSTCPKLTQGQQYHWRVRSRPSSAAAWSIWSVPCDFTTPKAPPTGTSGGGGTSDPIWLCNCCNQLWQHGQKTPFSGTQSDLQNLLNKCPSSCPDCWIRINATDECDCFA